MRLTLLHSSEPSTLSHTAGCDVITEERPHCHTLHHKARYDAMKGASLVCERLPILPHSMLPSAKLPKVLSSCCHHILVELNDYSTSLVIPKRSNIQVHPWSVCTWSGLQARIFCLLEVTEDNFLSNGGIHLLTG